MEIQQYPSSRGKVPEEKDLKAKQQVKKDLKAKQQVTSATTTTTAASASPPSASSSPSHEFSFTISLHSSSTPVPDKSRNQPAFAIDLSPADDIFFHGHLLPLHLLSQLPASPRSSTNSIDNFTLPIRDLLDDPKPIRRNSNCVMDGGNINHVVDSNQTSVQSNNVEVKGKSKAKSFSLFGWRKGCEVRGGEDKEKHKKKLKFDVTRVLKRYVRMMRPLLFFRGRRDNRQSHYRQPYSFSGNLNMRNKHELRGRRGEFSAPASMRTSPTNSGLLLETTTFPPPSDSTMEELQAAIQAAIAHCKNSITASEEKIKF
ncbi:hypothetical protein K2173_007405 [Erythroxylum novogranatense]|uniref:BRI1 kinase inhibitor 1 n=1 Tax=Erythroxylum novogranatense TaxID=1862640 RepID=A0AAV8T7G9_9ROSI|nr:hypothetical protein K2173_007405 [Erythroxylum novogranatense]